MKIFRTFLLSATFALGLVAFISSGPAEADGHLDATDDIYWIVTLDLADGQDDAFNTLMAEMVASTKAESGAKNYEWHRLRNSVHIYERYDTNEDAGIHLGNFKTKFAERFLSILTITRVEVYGPAEGGVRDALASFGAVFYEQVGGFAR